MKSKLTIILLLLYCGLLAQVPDTETFTFQNVYDVVHAEDATTTGDLSSCFTHATSSHFDASYTGYPANSLLRFRNYAAVTCPAIGDSYGGGIVAYLFVSGDNGYVSGECHGIIVSASDNASSAQWDYGSHGLVGASGVVYSTGTSNTSTIVTALGSGTYAAKICSDLTLNGYTDWVLPSQYDSHAFQVLYSMGIGGFIYGQAYWLSTEYDSTHALSAAAGFSVTTTIKAALCKVRAIRYF